MKKVIVVLLVLALVVGAGVWYFVSYRLDGLIKRRIEQAGSASFGCGSASARYHKHPGRLAADLQRLVANPPGYEPHRIHPSNAGGGGYANLDIKRVVIDKPGIVIEEMGGRTNFEQMLAELEKMEAESAPGEAGADEPQIVLRHFRMNESRAAFQSESLDRYTDVEIEAIELHDLRGTPTEVAQVIAREVLDEVTEEAATELLKAQAGKKYEEMEQKVGDALKEMLCDDKDSGDR
jgi:hypothetical protein